MFNLYSFTFSDSYQQEANITDDIIKISSDYQIPTLKLKNVEFRNFLYDYQSLIYVENDNVIMHRSVIETTDMQLQQYGNFEAGFSAIIENCKFSDSSFAYGMIYVPPNIDTYFSVPVMMGTN